MRTWDQWKRSSQSDEAVESVALRPTEPRSARLSTSPDNSGSANEPQPKADPRSLDLDDYDAIGRMREALSRHADELYENLGSDRSRQLCAAMFKALTLRESENRGIRRPQTLGRLAQIVDVPAAENSGH